MDGIWTMIYVYCMVHFVINYFILLWLCIAYTGISESRRWRVRHRNSPSMWQHHQPHLHGDGIIAHTHRHFRYVPAPPTTPTRRRDYRSYSPAFQVCASTTNHTFAATGLSLILTGILGMCQHHQPHLHGDGIIAHTHRHFRYVPAPPTTPTRRRDYRSYSPAFQVCDSTTNHTYTATGLSLIFTGISGMCQHHQLHLHGDGIIAYIHRHFRYVTAPPTTPTRRRDYRLYSPAFQVCDSTTNHTYTATGLSLIFTGISGMWQHHQPHLHGDGIIAYTHRYFRYVPAPPTTPTRRRDYRLYSPVFQVW